MREMTDRQTDRQVDIQLESDTKTQIGGHKQIGVNKIEAREREEAFT